MLRCCTSWVVRTSFAFCFYWWPLCSTRHVQRTSQAVCLPFERWLGKVKNELGIGKKVAKSVDGNQQLPNIDPKKNQKRRRTFFPQRHFGIPSYPLYHSACRHQKREVDSLRPRCSKGIAGDVLLLLYLYKMFKSVASLVLYCGALAALQK